MGLPNQLFPFFRIPFPLPEHSCAQIRLLKKCANFAIFVAELLDSSRRQVWVYNQVWQNPKTSVWMSILKLRGYFMCAWAVVNWWGGGVWKQKPTISKVPCEVTSKKMPITLMKQEKLIHFKMFFPHVSLKYMALSRLRFLTEQVISRKHSTSSPHFSWVFLQSTALRKSKKSSIRELICLKRNN